MQKKSSKGPWPLTLDSDPWIPDSIQQALAERAGAFAVDRARARTAGTSFYVAFLFLPTAKRRAIEAIYAFSRLTDDLVDEAPDAGIARAQLDAWRIELDRALDGQARVHPVARSMAEVCRRFGVARSLPAALIDGCRMDLTTPHYRTTAALDEYCYLVASVVGLMCIEVLGYRNASARRYAIALGRALQRTNILRDLGADAAAGRLYWPDEDLARFGYDRPSLLARLRQGSGADPIQDPLAALLRFECDHARRLYQDAGAALAPGDRRSLAVARIMGAVYYRLLDRIEQAGTGALTERVTLPARTKMAVAALTYARSVMGL